MRGSLLAKRLKAAGAGLETSTPREALPLT